VTKYKRLQQLPKIELHVHLEGAIHPETAFELARKNDVTLPLCDTPQDLYNYDTLDAFLGVYSAISASVVAVDDFRRITYEMLQSAAQGGARHVEFFISPHAHDGVPFARQFEGIRIGMRAFGFPPKAATRRNSNAWARASDKDKTLAEPSP